MYGVHDDEDPKSRQRCTDCPCCLVFVASLAVFFVLYVHVLEDGDVDRLYHGIDTKGRVCGVDPGVQDEPFLYWCMKSHFASAPQISLEHPICVDRCPGANQPATGRTGTNTMYEIEPDCAQVLGADGMASYRTIIVFDRYCMPDPKIFPDLANQVSSQDLASWEVWAAASMSSIHAAWPVLVGSFFVAVMLGYLYLVLLRHCAEPLIYLSMLLCVVGFASMGIYLFANAGTLVNEYGHGGDVQHTQNEENATRVAGFVCMVISILLLCLGCCMHTSISIGAACVEVACDTMFEMPALLLLPILKALFKGIMSIILLAGFLQLYSVSGIANSTTDGRSPHMDHSQEQKFFMIFYMLMSFWILAFVNALYQFIVAYAVAEYYYTPYDHDKEKDVGCCAVWDGVFYGLVHHGGSLAFGSLLIAIFMVVQKLIELAEKRNKEAGGNKVVDCILGCCMCWVSCCKEIVEHINKNAYIDIAITSDSFCEAAKSALAMIVEVGGAMAILNGATFVFTLFGVVLISMGAGGFTHLMVNQGVFIDQTSEFDVANPIAPMVVAGLIGVVVALSFMHVFDMTSDTLLYCYGLDLRSGRGGQTAPSALKELVHEHH